MGRYEYLNYAKHLSLTGIVSVLGRQNTYTCMAPLLTLTELYSITVCINFPQGRTELFKAIKNGSNNDVINAWIDAGANLDVVCKSDIVAMARDETDGDDPDFDADEKVELLSCPVLEAIGKPNLEVVKHLLEKVRMFIRMRVEYST